MPNFKFFGALVPSILSLFFFSCSEDKVPLSETSFEFEHSFHCVPFTSTFTGTTVDQYGVIDISGYNEIVSNAGSIKKIRIDKIEAEFLTSDDDALEEKPVYYTMGTMQVCPIQLDEPAQCHIAMFDGYSTILEFYDFKNFGVQFDKAELTAFETSLRDHNAISILIYFTFTDEPFREEPPIEAFDLKLKFSTTLFTLE